MITLQDSFDLHACQLKNCSGYPRACIAFPGYDHLRLTSPAAKKWNLLIKNGDAVAEECLAAVVSNLVKERNRMNARDRSQQLNPHLPGGVDTQPAVIQYFGGASGFQAKEAVRLNSSPPTREGDDGTNTERYLERLGKEYPAQTGEFQAHSVTLGPPRMALF